MFYHLLRRKGVRESVFKRDLKREIRRMLPGCIILDNDSGSLQGIPDVLILWKNRWAALECKAHQGAPMRPNQAHYVNRLNQMSFAAFIYPENMDQVLGDLQQSFRPIRAARLPRA